MPSGLKYIVAEHPDGSEDFLIFPQRIGHSDAKQMYIGLWPGCKVVRAGFCYFEENRETKETICKCYGGSTSLDLNSNPEVDSKLLTRENNREW